MSKEFLEVMNERYSCKNYSDKEPDENLIKEILGASTKAPSAKNMQAYHIYAIAGENNLKKLDEYAPCRYGAPVVLVITYKKDEAFVYFDGKTNSGAEDASILATYIMLYARYYGIDSCWINFFYADNIKKMFNIPDNEDIVLLMDLGYANSGVEPLKNHYLKKDIGELVTFLH